MGKQADRGVRGGAHPLPRLALIHESSLVADELRAQLIAKHLTKDEQVKIARHFREIFAGPKDRSGGVQTDDDCLSWFDKFFRRRVVVAPRQETLTALGAKLGAALESEPRASGKASITELTAVARYLGYEVSIGIGRQAAAKSHHLQTRLTSTLRLPPVLTIDHVGKGATASCEWQPQLRIDDVEGHRQTLWRALGTFASLIRDEAALRFPGISRQMSWIGFFENSASHTLDLLGSNGLDFPQCVYGVHTPQRLPPALQRHSTGLDFLQLDPSSGAGTFAQRENVDVVWVLRVSNQHLRLLLFVNWCDLAHWCEAEKRDLRQVQEALHNLHSDLMPSVRVLGGWLAQSVLQLDHAGPSLFEDAAALLRDLSEVFQPTLDSDGRATMLRGAVRTHALGGQERCTVNWVIPVRRGDPASAREGAEWLDLETKAIRTQRDGVTGSKAYVTLDNAPPIEDQEFVLRYASEMRFEGSKEGLHVLSINEFVDHTVFKGLAAQAAYFKTPMLYEHGEHVRRRAAHRGLDDVRLPGQPKRPGEEVGDTQGTEIAVPIPSNDADRKGVPLGVVLAQHSEQNGFGEIHVRRIDAIARLYSALEALRLGPPRWVGAFQAVLGLMQKTTAPGACMDTLLFDLNQSILLPEYQASMSYFLMRDEIGAFRNIGLAVANDLLPNCRRLLGLTTADAPAGVVARQESAKEKAARERAEAETRRLMVEAMRHMLLPRRKGYTVEIFDQAAPRVLFADPPQTNPPGLFDPASRFAVLEMGAAIGVPFVSGVASVPLGVLWMGWRRGKEPDFLTPGSEVHALQSLKDMGLNATLDAIAMIHSCHQLSAAAKKH